ncbi:hypothetical protein [Streptomyces lydicus]|uniref:hypothetical protein n=1 Tax=Streptomyces lydicus TaxID=47763 RepID=UPI0037CE4AA4
MRSPLDVVPVGGLHADARRAAVDRYPALVLPFLGRGDDLAEAGLPSTATAPSTWSSLADPGTRGAWHTSLRRP